MASSAARGAVSVQKKSAMSASGRRSMAATAERIRGKDLRTVRQIWATTGVEGVTRREMSGGGRWSTWMRSWRRWRRQELVSGGDDVAATVMTRTVTWTLWWAARRWARTRAGMRCPIPGLETMATCRVSIQCK
ncbi:iron regulated 2 [Striga asiatica]|uniref:Iron regulated 2 n=1 Tax=Striga asiatica TaxID=4170 RepID=A0A5A7P7Y2_STRAF|nr:iron regulated 2 [Striga asiatica]